MKGWNAARCPKAILTGTVCMQSYRSRDKLPHYKGYPALFGDSDELVGLWVI